MSVLLFNCKKYAISVQYTALYIMLLQCIHFTLWYLRFGEWGKNLHVAFRYAVLSIFLILSYGLGKSMYQRAVKYYLNEFQIEKALGYSSIRRWYIDKMSAITKYIYVVLVGLSVLLTAGFIFSDRLWYFDFSTGSLRILAGSSLFTFVLFHWALIRANALHPSDTIVYRSRSYQQSKKNAKAKAKIRARKKRRKR